MSPSKLVTRGPGATSLNIAIANQYQNILTINLTQKALSKRYFFGMLETWAKPNLRQCDDLY